MEKTFQPTNIEKECYQRWEEAGYFAPNPNKSPSYSIVIPPPNVTGSLHMGHGFQCALMDALIRYQRMQQRNTLWQVGTDHAGIATQMLVERQLEAKGQSRHTLGREAFLKEVYAWKNTSGNRITQQLRRLGASVDWSRERFTMDEPFCAVVQEVFIRLYEEGLLYRGQRLVNWDPKLKTAISDLEVISEEEAGQLVYIRYPFVDGPGHIVVATTRPETLFGDVAVAVHPEDERYRQFIGKHVKLPLTDRTIPIIADEHVTPEFGTGCVKITPAHDFNDYAMGQRHQLPMINIFTPDAHLNDQVPKNYQGLERFAARTKAVEELTAAELIEKITPHPIMIPRGDRSGVVIEPYLTYQWFVRVESLAKPAIEAVESGRIRFVPENWANTYFQWMHNLQDWCISRQLWWGHRIPAWFDEKGTVYVGATEEAVRTKHQLDAEVTLTQDNDVLDTWFSASLWPFATLGWPNNLEELKQFYPTDVLVTGFDIIFFWVARMVMMGLKFTGEVPFKTVYITGLIRDHDGQKMSKSKGNILDPLDLIDGIDLETLVQKRTRDLMQPHMAARIEAATRKQFPEGIAAFGTDALRFTFCALASTGRDIRFDLGRIEGYRNFCNKLWNAGRYITMQNSDANATLPDLKKLHVIDRWILSRLQQVITEVHHHFNQYRFDLLAQCLYEFVWNEFCDWYLELSKPLFYEENSGVAAGTRATLQYTFNQILHLLHPIMPFITETLWHEFYPEKSTLMLEPFPQTDDTLKDVRAEEDIAWLKSVVVAVRTIRSESNISPGKEINVLLQHLSAEDVQRSQQFDALLRKLAKITKIEILDELATAPNAASALAGEMKILVPLAGVIDKHAEIQRIHKEMQKLEKEIEVHHKKLSNPAYVDKAPAAVVEETREKWQNAQQAFEHYQHQLMQLEKE